MSEKVDTVTLTIDGVEVTVPKGTNLIDAAEQVGIEIPHYCYHRHLSIAGNCRMCQVAVEGMPKLTIGCNTTAADGMVVRTHHTSEEVADAQRATLEFLLINHPLDCTVCDQAGHCKLQDYYYQYNAQASRFTEEKVHKVKAEVLGPEIIYDGERCILCTRCVRFCEEVAGTSELGVFNRGDHSVIGIHQGTELNNPLAGTVVDLCPVGALTHRRWRFNSRIWYTSAVNSVCTGCSTGCNVNVAVRDNLVVQVKGRLNSEVNQEWMCDEGRYGFMRPQPNSRLLAPIVLKDGAYETAPAADALDLIVQSLAKHEGPQNTAVLLSPRLTLEELWLSVLFCEKVLWTPVSGEQVSLQIRQRALQDAMRVLVSPDYAANARAAALFGIAAQGDAWRDALEQKYRSLLKHLRSGSCTTVVLIGDGAVLADDLDSEILEAIQEAPISFQLGTRVSVGEGENDISIGTPPVARVVLPARTVNEKQGIMVNRDARFQRLQRLLDPPAGVDPEWRWLLRIAEAARKPLLSRPCADERALYRMMAKDLPALNSISLIDIGELGCAAAESGSSEPQA